MITLLATLLVCTRLASASTGGISDYQMGLYKKPKIGYHMHNLIIKSLEPDLVDQDEPLKFAPSHRPHEGSLYDELVPDLLDPTTVKLNFTMDERLNDFVGHL